MLTDLRRFFLEQYSADRMKLVVQMKTEDNMAAVGKMVTEIYSKIPSKGLGKQDFSFNRATMKKVPLPYEGNQGEVLLFNAMKDQTELYVLFTLEAE